MEPNFITWVDQSDKLEPWMKQLIHVIGDAYQQDLEIAKQQLAEKYSGNNIQP